MHPTLGSEPSDGTSVHQIVEDLLGERIEALAAWIQELDAQVRSSTVAGDEKTLKELRRALEAWSKRDPKFEERLTDRIDVLADRLATLSSAVNTTAAAHAGSDGEIAILRRELEQERTRFESALRDLRPSSDTAAVEELRRAVAELSAERPSRTADKGVAGMQEKVDNLGERLDTLAKTVATTAAGLAGREGELASLRRAFDEESSRIEHLVASLRHETNRSDVSDLEANLTILGQKLAAATIELAERERGTVALQGRVEREAAKLDAVSADLRGSIDALGVKLVALDERDDTEALATLDSRVAQLTERLGTLGSRVDSVAQTLDGASSDISAKEHELAALQRHLGETSARFDAALGEVREALAALPEAASVAELDHRIGPLAVQVDALASRLEEAETAASERLARETARTSEVERVLADAQGRLTAIEQARETVAAEITKASEAWSEEQAWVREQLDALVHAVSETPTKSDVETPLAEVSARLQELESARTSLTAEVARAREASTAESKALAAQLAEVAERESPVPPSEDMELKRLLVAFADRIEAIEQDLAATAAQSKQTANDALDPVRGSIEGLETRLATAEHELAAAADSHDVGVTLERLASRVESLEEKSKAPRPSVAPVPGDGRFRVELRALELRMQHAEGAARENREAVLVQLERLAARLEWRLQRLEADHAPEAETAEPELLGQVVPIRGGAET